eukprot:399939-Rhodomonas_salina.2
MQTDRAYLHFTGHDAVDRNLKAKTARSAQSAHQGEASRWRVAHLNLLDDNLVHWHSHLLINQLPRTCNVSNL